MGRLSRYLGLSSEDNLELEEDELQDDKTSKLSSKVKQRGRGDSRAIFLSDKDSFLNGIEEKDENGEVYNITSLTIRSFQDAKEIGECFRLGNAVIINLTEMEDEEARRVVDFCSGLIFGLKGRIEKITHRVFLVSPSNIVIQK